MATLRERTPGVWLARVFVDGKQVGRTFRGSKREVTRAVAAWEADRPRVRLTRPDDAAKMVGCRTSSSSTSMEPLRRPSGLCRPMSKAIRTWFAPRDLDPRRRFVHAVRVRKGG